MAIGYGQEVKIFDMNGNYEGTRYGATPAGSVSPSGVPISNSGGSAQNITNVDFSGMGKSLDSGLSSLGANISDAFNGLQDMIMKNTDKNNAWSAAQAQKQMDFQERMNSIAMDFNAAEAAKTRDWQEAMSNTAHQREIADLKAAGLNPVLSASGGNGAAVGSGATAQGVTSAGAKGDGDQSANSALVSLYGALINAQQQMYNANLSAKTNLAIAEKQVEANMYAAALAADASKYGAGTNYAATVYAADMAHQNAINSSPWQFAGQVLDGFSGRTGSSGSANNSILNKIGDLARKGFSLRYRIGSQGKSGKF